MRTNFFFLILLEFYSPISATLVIGVRFLIDFGQEGKHLCIAVVGDQLRTIIEGAPEKIAELKTQFGLTDEFYETMDKAGMVGKQTVKADSKIVATRNFLVGFGGPDKVRKEFWRISRWEDPSSRSELISLLDNAGTSANTELIIAERRALYHKTYPIGLNDRWVPSDKNVIAIGYGSERAKEKLAAYNIEGYTKTVTEKEILSDLKQAFKAASSATTEGTKNFASEKFKGYLSIPTKNKIVELSSAMETEPILAEKLKDAATLNEMEQPSTSRAGAIVDHTARVAESVMSTGASRATTVVDFAVGAVGTAMEFAISQMGTEETNSGAANVPETKGANAAVTEEVQSDDEATHEEYSQEKKVEKVVEEVVETTEKKIAINLGQEAFIAAANEAAPVVEEAALCVADLAIEAAEAVLAEGVGEAVAAIVSAPILGVGLGIFGGIAGVAVVGTGAFIAINALISQSNSTAHSTVIEDL